MSGFCPLGSPSILLGLLGLPATGFIISSPVGHLHSPAGLRGFSVGSSDQVYVGCGGRYLGRSARGAVIKLLTIIAPLSNMEHVPLLSASGYPST